MVVLNIIYGALMVFTLIGMSVASISLIVWVFKLIWSKKELRNYMLIYIGVIVTSILIGIITVDNQGLLALSVIPSLLGLWVSSRMVETVIETVPAENKALRWAIIGWWFGPWVWLKTETKLKELYKEYDSEKPKATYLDENLNVVKPDSVLPDKPDAEPKKEYNKDS